MEKQKTITQQYKDIVDCFIIMSNINGMDMQEFRYGYNLYLLGKRMNQNETASILAEHLISETKFEMENSDDAFEVIEIREYIESLENSEEHTNIK